MTRSSLAALALCGVAMLAAVPAAAATPRPATSPTLINWQLSPTEISSTCKAEIATVRARFAAIVNSRGARTFQSVVLPLENLSADLNDRTVAQTMLFNVAEDPKVRQAAEGCNNDESNVFTELTAEPALYAALAAAQRSATAKTVYDRKLTAFWLDAVQRSGAGLPAQRRAEFVRLSQQLNDLQNKYAENLANDASTITITAAQAKSLPPDFVAKLKRAGDAYVVPVAESTVTTFLQNESDADARKAFSVAYNNRAASTNVGLLERAIVIRDRLAHLLGYTSWAAYQLSNRMAKSPARVTSFLSQLDEKLLPKAKDDVEHLRQLKAQDTKNPNAVLDPWDVSYYDNMLNRTQYAVDTNAVRQYFPVQHVIDSVLDIYHTLLGVNFERVTRTDAWNPDVLEYRVSDTRTGHLIGTTYFDLYPRPGKYSHFANFPLLPIRVVNGAYRAPVVAIVGNWPKPAPGQPALLSHDDVITFFHEFGHNLAALLTTAPYETLSSGFVQDFVEAPSQMLENFMWQPSILKKVSSNWQTGAPLPDELIDKMIKARYVDDAYFTTRQIMLATIDMDYHTSGPNVDTTAVWERVARDMTPLPMTPGTHPQGSFGHLMGGYDAGYYGYLWSKVYAQDMFTAFEQGGLENPGVGMRYRKDILEPARTYDPDTEVHAFLGRAMSPNAFYEEFGISNGEEPHR